MGSDNIVWVHGPFPCGENPDIIFFRAGLKLKLKQCREMAICDNGYRGEARRVQRKGDQSLFAQTRRDNSTLLARHETINGRIKFYKATSGKWRHSHEQHRQAFMAIVCLVQMSFPYEPLFEVRRVE